MTDNEVRRRGVAPRMVRGVIWTVFGLSVLSAVLGSGLGIVAVVYGLGSGQISTILSAGGVLPSEADRGTATLDSGMYDSAAVTVSGLSTGTMVVYSIGSTAFILAGTALAISLAVLSWSLLKAAPFGPGLSRTVTLGGAVVLLCGIVGIGLGVLGSWMIAGELNASGAGLDDFWPTAAAVDSWPVWVGVTMLLLGLAFDYGDRLQQDNAGLV